MHTLPIDFPMDRDPAPNQNPGKTAFDLVSASRQTIDYGVDVEVRHRSKQFNRDICVGATAAKLSTVKWERSLHKSAPDFSNILAAILISLLLFSAEVSAYNIPHTEQTMTRLGLLGLDW